MGSNRITPEEQEIVERSKDRRAASLEARIQRAERRRLQKMQAEQQAALEAQRANSAAQRDKQQNQESRTNAVQRANLSLGAANANAQSQADLNDQQRRALRDRDKRLNQFETDENRRNNRDLRERDQRQFGYTTAENDQKFGQQLERDSRQQGYTLDRDRLQGDQTLQRDILQGDQTLQRDILQGGIQADRDERLNMFGAEEDQRQQQNTLERDMLQNRFQSERDARLNIFDTQRDVRRQQFEQQSRYQQEIEGVSARWQEQVNAAKSAGLDFSPQQQKEMQDLDRAFRRNILNGDYPEDIKQRAMLEHQKKLAAIIPEQKVVSDQQLFKQSIVVDEETGSRLLAVRDPRGGIKFEPLPTSGMPDEGNLRYQEQAAQKQQEAIRKAMLQREDEYQGLIDRLASETDAEMNPKYSSAEDVKKEAMKRFARKEQVYREHYGLPPLAPFQEEADQVRAAQEAAAAKKPQNPYRAILQQPSAESPATTEQAPLAPQLSKPEIDEEILRKRNSQQNTGSAVELSSSNLADQINAAKKSGNNEAVKALNTIDQLTRKLGGRTPEEGSEEMEALIEALKIIRKNGYSVQPKAAPVKEPGPFFDGAMAFPL